MIFGQDRRELRQMYVDSWQKYCGGEVLSPLEAQIAAVINDHPEYQSMLTNENIDQAFTPDGGASNPFLHMGLHLAIREQIATDRPPGIAAIFGKVLHAAGNQHTAEHLALESLAETLWEAQGSNQMPDEQAYLDRLRRL